MYMIIVLFSLALLVFLLSWGKIERQWIGLIVVILLISSGAVTVSELVNYIDWDVLGLLIIMSIYTVYLERSGFAYIVARSILKHTNHSLHISIFALSFLAGFMSIFIDNVSVVLIFYPIVFILSKTLEIQPTIPMILVALSANIAGSATMVGDPPALITAGAFRLSFIDFIVYKGKPSMFFITLISMVLAITVSIYTSLKNIEKINEKKLTIDEHNLKNKNIDNKNIDKLFLTEAVIFLCIQILLLSLRNILTIPLSLPAFIAVTGLSITRIIFHRDVKNVKSAIKQGFEWKLPLFLTSVFILSGAFEKHNIAKIFSEHLVNKLNGDIFKITSTLILISTAFSGVMDNVPLTLTMIPVVKAVSNLLSYDPVILMWSTLIGITLGGNLTYIGASANISAVRIIEKNGFKITFIEFLKISSVYNTISLLSAWIIYTLIYIYS